MRIDTEFDVPFAEALAAFEAYNKHYYRPNTYLHKWWARRCGSTFRAILKHLVEIPHQQDYYASGGLAGKIILDPMLGGGTTLHEAIRMGANVIGADIDPIPILQAQASLSTIPLDELKVAFDDFYVAVSRELAPFYSTNCPHCTTAVPLQYTLYGLQKSCACETGVFLDTLTLRHNPDGSAFHIHPVSRDIYLDQNCISAAVAQPHPHLYPRQKRRCERCKQPYREDLAQSYYKRYVPVAIWSACPAHGQFFTTPQAADRVQEQAAAARRAALNFFAADFPIAHGPKTKSLHEKKVGSYLDLFSSRQLLYLHHAQQLLPDFTPLVRLNLALLVSTSLEFNSLLCGYKGTQRPRPGAIRHTFAHHAYSFPHTALENNPIYPRRASGNLQNLFYRRIVRGRNWAQKPVERRVLNGKTEKVAVPGETDAGIEVHSFADLQAGSNRFLLLQGSAVELDLPDSVADYIVTDPPYFDSVQYSDLASYFHVWLRQLLPDNADWQVTLAETAVDPRQKGNGQYARVLRGIFCECARVLKKENGRLIFTFHHWNPRGWAALTAALHAARFQLINRYVVHAENPISVHIVNQNALLHDVILVLAPPGAAVAPHWPSPVKIETGDSERFCYDCGTAVGWFLQQDIDTAAINARWQLLLPG